MTFAHAVVLIGVVGLSWQTARPAAQSEASRALVAAEARWQANKPASYEFTIDVMCFCKLAPQPPAFRVVNDVPSATADLGESTDLYARYNTVPRMFSEIRRFIEQKPVKLDVKYDAAYGFPVSIELDMRSDMLDDELKVSVTNFKPLKPPSRP